jgi:hypothetical protein
MSTGRSKQIARQHSPSAPRDGLLVALVQRQRLAAVVPLVLDILQDDPLASAGRFRGDLLRGLMEVPDRFWGRHPQLYERYRAALRAGAGARRQLPPEDRLQFWGPLETPAGRREEHRRSRGADDAGGPRS